MKYQQPYGISDPNAPYINGDPSIARQGSILPAGAAEYPQREIVNLIAANDIIPSDSDLEQLTRGVRSQWVNFAIDTGSTNNLSIALDPPLQEYKQGFPIRVLAKNSNTGPSALNINSLGNRPIKRANGADLQPEDIRAGMVALLVDDGTNFQMLNFLGAIGGVTNNFNIDIPYAQDTSTTANTLIGNYGAEITSATPMPGDLIMIRVNNRNTGPVNIQVSGSAGAQPNASVRRNDGLQLEAGDILKDECILIEYNVTYWQMLRLVRSQVYFRLPTAELVLYVRPDGSDTNDGSENTAAKAFKTIQGAINYVRDSFLIAGRTVRIQLGIPGTYAQNAQILISNIQGSLIIQGDKNNKNAYVIQGPTAAQASYPSTFSLIGSGTQVLINGVMFSASNSSHNVIEVIQNASLQIGDCSWGGTPLTTAAAIATFSGAVQVYNTIDVYTQMMSFFFLSGGTLTIGLWYTLFNTHNVNWGYGSGATGAFIRSVAAFAYIAAGYCQFTGGAIGYRYLGWYNSTIVTNGGSDYLPGSIPGYVDVSSVYA